MTYRLVTCEHCKREARVFRSPSARFEPRFCNRACSNAARLAHAWAALPGRFWSQVRRDVSAERYPGIGPCWEWTGRVNQARRGYGAIDICRTTWPAHRVAWLLTHGDPGASFICHHCDNPMCVRPEHLFAGTHQDNMNDMKLKGRHWMNQQRERLGAA